MVDLKYNKLKGQALKIMNGSQKEERIIYESILTFVTDSKLHIQGSVMTYYDDEEIVLEKVETTDQGSSELLLDLNIKEGSSPMESAVHLFSFTEHGDHVNDYDKVTIRYDDKSYTIDI